MRMRTLIMTAYFFNLLLVGLVIVTEGQRSQINPSTIFKAPAASEPVKYTAPDQSFEVVFPGKPEYKFSETEDAKTDVTFFKSEAAFAIVSVYKYKPDVNIEAPQFLKIYKTRFSSRGNTKIDSEAPVSVNGVAGTELKIDSFYVYEVIRVFVVGNRVFEIKFDAANWNQMSNKNRLELLTEANIFISSFKILDDPR